MISRHWKGLAKIEFAHAYMNHLTTDTFPKLSGIDGFVGASILTRDVDSGTEFLVITVWDSLQAIERFAGVPSDVAVVPETVQAMMIEYDEKAVHYEVVETYSPRCGEVS